MEIVVGLVLLVIVTGAASAVVVPYMRMYAEANDLAEGNTQLDNLANIMEEDLLIANAAANVDVDTAVPAKNTLNLRINLANVDYTVGVTGSDNAGLLLRNGTPVLSGDFFKRKTVSFTCTDDNGAYVLTLSINRSDGTNMTSRQYTIKPLSAQNFFNAGTPGNDHFEIDPGEPPPVITNPPKDDPRLSDALLVSLSYSAEGGASKSVPGFNSGTLEYNIELPYGTDYVDLSATASQPRATVTGNTQYVISGGTATATITVTSADGTVTKTYTVRFTVAQPSIYKITFEANGGSVSPTSAETNSNGNRTLANLPTPTRDGYTFNGWFTASSGGSSVTLSRVYTGDTTIYAQWTALPTYTVTFALNDGNSVSPTSAKTDTSGKLTLTSLPIPTRSGHTFTGWFTATTGGRQVYIDEVYTSNTTLYAQWSVLSGYRITLDFNDGTGNQGWVLTNANGYLSPLPSPPNRIGFAFDGWFTAATGGTQVTTSTNFTADATIYAHWTRKTYTVSWNANGGKPEINTGLVNYDDVITEADAPSNPEREGFTFDRWYYDEEATKPLIDHKITDNIMFYAGWTYTLTYNADDSTDGTVPPAMTGLVADRAVTVANGTGLVKGDEVFDSWNTKADGTGTKVPGGGSFISTTGDITLYAQWKPKPTGDVVAMGSYDYSYDGAIPGRIQVPTTARNGGTFIDRNITYYNLSEVNVNASGSDNRDHIRLTNASTITFTIDQDCTLRVKLGNNRGITITKEGGESITSGRVTEYSCTITQGTYTISGENTSNTYFYYMIFQSL